MAMELLGRSTESIRAKVACEQSRGRREPIVTRLSDIVREQSKPGHGPDRSGQRPDGATPESAKQVGMVQASMATLPLYERAERELIVLSQAVRAQSGASLDRLVPIAGEIARNVQREDGLLQQVFKGRLGRPVIHNLINVAILAVKVGIGFRYDPVTLERLALAALVHDIGMWTLPESLLAKTDVYSQAEREQLAQHPQQGAKVIAAMGTQYEWLSAVVLQEHERWCGQGYPQHLRGGQIHEHAQIIGLVDTLDAMINPRSYRRQMIPHFAVRELMVKSKSLFSLPMLKVLVNQLSLYPLGTTVRLNTGEVGVVNQLNQRYPLRPHLTIDQAAGAGQAKILDLSESATLHIVEVLRPLETT